MQKQNKMKNKGIYFLVALISSIIFISSFSFIEFINTGSFDFVVIFVLSIFSIPAYFVGGIPSSMIIDFIRRRFLGTLPKLIQFVISLILYIVAGIIVSFVVIAILRYEDRQFPWGDFAPYAQIGIGASLLYFFVLIIVRWLNKVKD